MAIYRNAKFSFGSVDISSKIRSLAFNQSAEEQDDSAMGDDTRSTAGGLQRWSFEGEANQGFGTGSLDAAFATKVGTTAAVLFRPYASATALSDGNPKFAGTGLLVSYMPAQGAVGDQWVAPFSIVSAGTLTRTGAT